eukprot:8227886-Alexandrium_andersonii.AAC.1
MQLVADIACGNPNCLRVGDIGVLKCAACGYMKTAYAPDVLKRAKENRLAKYITRNRTKPSAAS